MFKKIRIHYVILILAVGAVAIALLFLRFRHADGAYNRVLIIGSNSVSVSIADTEATRDQGLSDTASLPANAGKLFVFQTPGTPGFWMKDMNYGLDFVWIGSDMKIVAVTPNVADNTYPEIYYPPQSVQYVLEVNAGFSTRHHLTVGEQTRLQ